MQGNEMRLGVEAGDREFLVDLQKCGPATVQQLCDRQGVTPTAIRQRLTRLQDAHLVSRVALKGDRGRPSHSYALTTDGLRLIGDNYRDLALLLWEEITRIEEVDVRSRLIRRLRDQLVERYGREVHSASVKERLWELQGLLRTLGFDVEILDTDQGILPILRENTCPYHDLAAQDASICDLEQTVFAEVLGVPVNRTQCCRDGDRHCEFVPEVSVAT